MTVSMEQSGQMEARHSVVEAVVRVGERAKTFVHWAGRGACELADRATVLHLAHEPKGIEGVQDDGHFHLEAASEHFGMSQKHYSQLGLPTDVRG